MTWEADWADTTKIGGTRYVLARKIDSPVNSAREWHYIQIAVLRNQGYAIPEQYDNCPAWEADWDSVAYVDGVRCVKVRNENGRYERSRVWRYVPVGEAGKFPGITVPQQYRRGKKWDVDWSRVERVEDYPHDGCRRKRTMVWSRNEGSHRRESREWHWKPLCDLRTAGVAIPPEIEEGYLPSSRWEVDGEKKRGETHVWARNPGSASLAAREWHWTTVDFLRRVGVLDYPQYKRNAQERTEINGYVWILRHALPPERLATAFRFGLLEDGDFSESGGGDWSRVAEHRLIAAEKYGDDYDPDTMVVRHKNGIKADNDPENLLIGTHEENMMDHNTARKAAMYYHQECRVLERENAALDADLSAALWQLAQLRSRYEGEVLAAD